MATVTGVSAERVLEIENSSVVDGEVTEAGRLTLIRKDGQTIDAGLIPGAGAVRTLTPEAYGAVGDGVANDQTALQNMLNDLRAGENVLMTKRYRHSAQLTVPVPNTTWYWRGGELLATNRTTATLRIHGPAANGTTMHNARHIVDPWTGAESGGRSGAGDVNTAPFSFENAERVTMYAPYSANSAQTGFYLSGTKDSYFENVTVDRSFADGFHMTHNCEDVRVAGIEVYHPGDDAVAVVSYKLKSGAAIDPCRRIHVSSIKVRYCHARGVSIVGGDDILYTDLDVWFTRAAGAAIMAESGYNTHTPQRCKIKGGYVGHVGYMVRANGTDDPGLDHGALFLLNQQNGTVMTDCRFQDITCKDMATSTAGTGSTFTYMRSIPQSGGTFSGCGFDRITLERGPGPTGTGSASGTNTGITAVGTIDNRLA